MNRKLWVVPASIVVLSAPAWAGEADVGSGEPSLPDPPYAYAAVDLPAHVMNGGRRSSAVAADNTPADNPVTDEGATLGRVLFYDTRLSENETVSCATCHQQERGFSAAERLSIGLHGESTARRSMSLANARFYSSGRFFWDERAASLEAQVLIPIQDPVEMGMDLGALEDRLARTAFYPALFEEAFGSPHITSDRISKALAQFVRSMVSVGSRYDRALEQGDGRVPDPSIFTEQELLGQQLFESRDAAGGGQGGRRGMGAMRGMRGMGPNITCSECHATTLQIADRARNNGLDASIADEGVGGGRFKVPSLRNVAVRAPFMHDGRFETLHEVVEFYNGGVQRSRNLDPALMHASMHGLELSEVEVNAIVAFLETLTDEDFLTDPRFSDPFEH